MLHVAPHWPARILRVCGVLVPALWAAGELVRSSDGAPFVIALFATFGFAFAAVTARSMPVTPRAITTGAVVGVSAALAPALLLVIWPPVPATGDWAFGVVAIAAVVAARLGDLRAVDRTISGLLAATISAFLIMPVLAVMAKVGPESWVPRTLSHALTPAARLAERRDLAAEPYLAVLLIGAVLAVLLGALVTRTRGGTRVAPPARLVDGPRPIELGEV
jgi:hypothetical protein